MIDQEVVIGNESHESGFVNFYGDMDLVEALFEEISPLLQKDASEIIEWTATMK